MSGYFADEFPSPPPIPPHGPGFQIGGCTPPQRNANIMNLPQPQDVMTKARQLASRRPPLQRLTPPGLAPPVPEPLSYSPRELNLIQTPFTPTVRWRRRPRNTKPIRFDPYTEVLYTPDWNDRRRELTPPRPVGVVRRYGYPTNFYGDIIPFDPDNLGGFDSMNGTVDFQPNYTRPAVVTPEPNLGESTQHSPFSPYDPNRPVIIPQDVIDYVQMGDFIDNLTPGEDPHVAWRTARPQGVRSFNGNGLRRKFNAGSPRMNQSLRRDFNMPSPYESMDGSTLEDYRDAFNETPVIYDDYFMDYWRMHEFVEGLGEGAPIDVGSCAPRQRIPGTATYNGEFPEYSPGAPRLNNSAMAAFNSPQRFVYSWENTEGEPSVEAEEYADDEEYDEEYVEEEEELFVGTPGYRIGGVGSAPPSPYDRAVVGGNLSLDSRDIQNLEMDPENWNPYGDSFANYMNELNNSTGVGSGSCGSSPLPPGVPSPYVSPPRLPPLIPQMPSPFSPPRLPPAPPSPSPYASPPRLPPLIPQMPSPFSPPRLPPAPPSPSPYVSPYVIPLPPPTYVSSPGHPPAPPAPYLTTPGSAQDSFANYMREFNEASCSTSGSGPGSGGMPSGPPPAPYVSPTPPGLPTPYTSPPAPLSANSAASGPAAASSPYTSPLPLAPPTPFTPLPAANSYKTPNFGDNQSFGEFGPLPPHPAPLVSPRRPMYLIRGDMNGSSPLPYPTPWISSLNPGPWVLKPFPGRDFSCIEDRSPDFRLPEGTYGRPPRNISPGGNPTDDWGNDYNLQAPQYRGMVHGIPIRVFNFNNMIRPLPIPDPIPGIFQEMMHKMTPGIISELEENGRLGLKSCTCPERLNRSGLGNPSAASTPKSKSGNLAAGNSNGSEAAGSEVYLAVDFGS